MPLLLLETQVYPIPYTEFGSSVRLLNGIDTLACILLGMHLLPSDPELKELLRSGDEGWSDSGGWRGGVTNTVLPDESSSNSEC